jgi:hypothetical protein
MLPRTPPAFPPPIVPRAYQCRCERPVFFPNSQCLACSTPLGYCPLRRDLLPLEPVPGRDGLWRRYGQAKGGMTWRRCPNFEGAPACNWLVPEADGEGTLCRCCRLTRTLPDVSDADNATYVLRLSLAQRRLVSQLIGLELPVQSKVSEDPEHGLAFDLLRAPPGGPPVTTGHADGIITIDVEEADDARREQRRTDLHEPYRTLLGHLRHESGHYYWQRLVEPDEAWLEAYRAAFGDERADYGKALKTYYANGAPADWNTRHISAYASSHPWEDWAETWAHYLHLRDTLDTARSFGLDGSLVQLEYEPFGADALEGDDQAFLTLVNAWMELTGVLNELSRSMGVADFYPFVLSIPALRKLHLVHRIATAAPQAPPPSPPP